MTAPWRTLNLSASRNSLFQFWRTSSASFAYATLLQSFAEVVPARLANDNLWEVSVFVQLGYPPDAFCRFVLRQSIYQA